MKIAAAALLILLTRLAFSRAESEAEAEADADADAVADADADADPGVFDFLSTPCVFDQSKISMIVYNQKNPSGVNVGLNQRCNEIDNTKPVVILVHGFISSPEDHRFRALSKSLVKKHHTVLALDWSSAACIQSTRLVRLGQYSNAVEHTRPTGQLLANYVLSLIDQCKVPLKKLMFIGHSLGAHISGFASKKIQEIKREKVARIIGADPAAPEFWNNTCEERLCNSDAEHVISLISSTLGIYDPIGHINLYFNGVYQQPGCSFIDLACTHSRPLDYLNNVLNDPNCVFPGRSKLLAKRGEPDSTTTDCVVLTSDIFDLAKFSDTKHQGSFQLWVREKEPHCVPNTFKCAR